MKVISRSLSLLFCMTAYTLLMAFGPTPASAQTPAMGAKVPDFTLSTPDGTTVQLAKELRKSDYLVLIFLRGYPGYQCPYCQKQIHDMLDHGTEFAARKANVLLVYPGPPADLNQRAQEALAKQVHLPKNVTLVIDPDYTATNRYGLRWDAPHETAYPSTFVLDRAGRVLFEKISHSHADRTTSEEILTHIP